MHCSTIGFRGSDGDEKYIISKKGTFIHFAQFIHFLLYQFVYLHKLFQMRDVNLNNTASNLRSVAHKNYLLLQAVSLSLSVF